MAASYASQRAPASSTRWARLARRLRPPRRIHFTAQGTWLILLTLGVGFAALNTGNNLLYLVLGMMLTVIGVSGILSELSVGGLSVERQLPEELHAGKPVSITLSLANLKRLLPAIGIRVYEEPGVDADVQAAYFVYVPAAEEASRTVRYTFRRRGRHELPMPFVETSYPFGLFRRGYRAGRARQVLVYPEIRPVQLDLKALRGAGGEEDLRRRGRGDEFFGLRSFHDGDDVRAIHWKISAKRARLVVREDAEQAWQVAVVRFEPGPHPDLLAFEEGVTEVASRIAALVGAGFAVGYEGPGERIPPEVGRPQLRRILSSLALLAAGEGEPPPAREGDALRMTVSLRGGRVVVGGGS